MTLQVSQDELIEKALLNTVDNNTVDNNPWKTKSEIITLVVDEMGVPRPTVRRVKGQLLVKLAKYVEVLL